MARNPSDFPPTIARPLDMPRFLVAGPPCGGKTTFVAEHAAADQSIVDFDDIVEGLGQPRYEADPEIAEQARRIWVASVPQADWVIWTAPRRRERGRFRSQYQAQVIVVMASMAECLKRAEDRPPIWREHIRAWFAAWEPSRSGSELIVRTDR
jgi:predicted kinase